MYIILYINFFEHFVRFNKLLNAYIEKDYMKEIKI